MRISRLTMGSKTNFDEYDKSTVGIIVGMDTGVPKLEMAKDGSDGASRFAKGVGRHGKF